MQIKLRFCHGGTELLKSRFSRLAAFQAPKNLSISGCAVANIDLLFDYCGWAVPERVNDPAPIGLAPVPAGLYQRAVGHRPRRGLGISKGFCPVHAHGNKARDAFAVT